MNVLLVKWCKIQEIHRHSDSLIYVDSHSQALFRFTKITGFLDTCMFNFFHPTIPFNFMEWFMILFSFSDVKYSLSIFCIEYVLTKNIILLNLYLFTKLENDSSLCQGIAQCLCICLTWLKHQPLATNFQKCRKWLRNKVPLSWLHKGLLHWGGCYIYMYLFAVT